MDILVEITIKAFAGDMAHDKGRVQELNFCVPARRINTNPDMYITHHLPDMGKIVQMAIQQTAELAVEDAQPTAPAPTGEYMEVEDPS